MAIDPTKYAVNQSLEGSVLKVGVIDFVGKVTSRSPQPNSNGIVQVYDMLIEIKKGDDVVARYYQNIQTVSSVLLGAGGAGGSGDGLYQGKIQTAYALLTGDAL